MSKINPHYQGVEQLPNLPPEWDYYRLRNLAKVYPSNVDKKSSDDETSIKLCNYTDVYYNERISSDIEFMEATTTDSKISKFTLQAGDVLLTKDSESWDDIGIPTFVPKDLPGVVCGYHLFLLRPNKDRIYPEFLYWCAESRVMAFQFERSAKGVTRFGVATHSAADTYVPCPPLEEQKKITEFLNYETQKIAAPQERLGTEIELLQEKREALITRAVTGQIDLADSKETESMVS